MAFNVKGLNQKPTIETINAKVVGVGIRCVSESYLHAHSSLAWECIGDGHRFRGHWVYVRNRIRQGEPVCAKCSGKEKRDETAPADFARLREYVACRGGELITADLSTARGEVVIRCGRHGEWKSSWWSLLRYRSWCRKCHLEAVMKVRRERTLQKVRAETARRGGACLSTDYSRHNEKLTFRCSAKHQFTATAPSILAGHWCRECATSQRAKARRMPLEEIVEIARSRGGKCVSPEYSSGAMKLEWECAHGH